ncbi:hypothetical protein TNCV_4674981 [Trichonephila clavipes]|nr:hypothetical protein TNCV_4674981 [Trichonephila clavipes]
MSQSKHSDNAGICDVYFTRNRFLALCTSQQDETLPIIFTRGSTCPGYSRAVNFEGYRRHREVVHRTHGGHSSAIRGIPRPGRVMTQTELYKSL